MRALVIEDNKDTADSLSMLLEQLGCESLVALNGTSGVEVAREAPPDIVFCDIGLPDLDGYAVARYLRAEPWGRRVTLVADDTAQVTFAVHCAPPPPAYGAIVVVISTQVINTPVPSGYTITLDGTSSQQVRPNDSVTFDHVAAGLHSIRLTGAPPYCPLGGFFGVGANPVSVRVARDSTSRVSFGVLCLP